MIYRSDDFTRADSSGSLGAPSDGGAGWSVFASGSWGIVSHQAYTGVATVREAAWLEAGASDVDVQVTVNALGGGGPILRQTGADQYFSVAVAVDGITLYRYNSGSYTPIGSWAGAVSPGAVVKISGSGSTITVSLNGTQVVAATDAQGQTATSHGIQAYNETVTRFAAFSIAAPAGAPAAPTYYAFTAGGLQYAVQA